MQTAPYASPSMVVRPEIADSVIRLLDDEAESFSDGKEPGEQALSATFAGIAGYVRAGMSIYFELSFEPYGTPMSREITNAIGHYINSRVSEVGDNAEADWHYIAGIAALAADIEAACKQIEADRQVQADAAAIGVSVNELLSTRGYAHA